ncbi:hypothetical protein [Kordiimonas gwangyangensis]|uniref:hypothetical protein n=1 Tax=Kordiimonas gwangyangensis TaxID=288022 RepID=UPI00037A9B6D|nr:hypothetical protein [Kordiimonas gwangyangensis]
MATDEKLTANCPDCGQAVRFPGNRGHIKFNCPGCGGGLEWSPDGKHIPQDGDIEVAPAADTTASFYDAVKASLPPADQGAAPAAPPSAPARPKTAAPKLEPPRKMALLYIAGCVLAGLATEKLNQTAGEDTLLNIAFFGCVALTYYLAFRAVRIATRFGVGRSVTTLIIISLTIPFIITAVTSFKLPS